MVVQFAASHGRIFELLWSICHVVGNDGPVAQESVGDSALLRSILALQTRLLVHKLYTNRATDRHELSRANVHVLPALGAGAICPKFRTILSKAYASCLAILFDTVPGLHVANDSEKFPERGDGGAADFSRLRIRS